MDKSRKLLDSLTIKIQTIGSPETSLTTYQSIRRHPGTPESYNVIMLVCPRSGRCVTINIAGTGSTLVLSQDALLQVLRS